MNRLSPSREPAAWIGLLSAVVALGTLLGVHLPGGTEAAIAAVITAGSAVFIRSKVRPADRSVEVKPDTAVAVLKTGPDGVVQSTEYQLMNGKARQIGATAPVIYATPTEVAAKSTADLKAEHDRSRAALGIARPAKPKKAAKKNIP